MDLQNDAQRERHTFPNPTADPAVAKITPSLLPKLALSSVILCNLSSFCCKIIKNTLILQQKYKST